MMQVVCQLLHAFDTEPFTNSTPMKTMNVQRNMIVQMNWSGHGWLVKGR